jgi:hypothetical protein
MTLPKAILCDLDGTLALLQDRPLYDATHADQDLLNNPIANILEVYNHQKIQDISLILLSARTEKYREVTERWLKKHKLDHYKKLFLRNNDDMRQDTVVKKEIYEQHIKGNYDVLFILEDRDRVVKMWRDEGLTCLQVAYGNF